MSTPNYSAIMEKASELREAILYIDISDRSDMDQKCELLLEGMEVARSFHGYLDELNSTTQSAMIAVQHREPSTDELDHFRSFVSMLLDRVVAHPNPPHRKHEAIADLLPTNIAEAVLTSSASGQIATAVTNLKNLGTSGANLAAASSIGMHSFAVALHSTAYINDTDTLFAFSDQFGKIAQAVADGHTDEEELKQLVAELRAVIARLEAENANLQLRLKKPLTVLRTQFLEGFTTKLGEQSAEVISSWLKPLGVATITGAFAAVGLTGMLFSPEEAIAVEKCVSTYVQIVIESTHTD